MRFADIGSYQIEIYRTNTGKEPFNEWLAKLSDHRAYQKIFNRLDQVQIGNLGDCRALKMGSLSLKYTTDRATEYMEHS